MVQGQTQESGGGLAWEQTRSGGSGEPDTEQRQLTVVGGSGSGGSCHVTASSYTHTLLGGCGATGWCMAALCPHPLFHS